MELSPFEYVTRKKLRFGTGKGFLVLEDLWDLPLTSETGKPNLNDVAKGINRDLKVVDEESFVPSEASTAGDNDARVMLDAVKRIIAVKVDERKVAAEARTKASQKQELLEALAEAERGEIKKKTPEELRAMLAAL